MEWLILLEIIFGITAIGLVLKWIFFPRFMLKLSKKNFENDRKDINDFIYFCDAVNGKEYKPYPIQLQCATNILLGTSKFHYSLFVNKINDMWELNKIRSDLIYSHFYIRQIVINNEAKLEYIIKERKLIKIRNICIGISIGIGALCLTVGVFEIFFLGYLIENFYFDSKDCKITKICFLFMCAMFIFFFILVGSKINTALSLKNLFNIQDGS